jgi:VIT1/CCC1 family predicted Fe2+/Mn2+ transporter
MARSAYAGYIWSDSEISMSRLHAESHRSHRVGWLRASLLGANDGLVSVASLLVGVATVLLTALIGHWFGAAL